MNSTNKKTCVLFVWLVYFGTCFCVLIKDYSSLFSGFISSLSIPILYSILSYQWLNLSDNLPHKIDRIKNDTLIIGLGVLFFSFASIILESNKAEVGSAWSSSIVYLGLYGLFVGFVFSLINARFNNKKEYPLFFSAIFFFTLLLYYKSYEFDFFNARIENIGYFFTLNLVVLSMLLIHFFCSLLIKNLSFEKIK